MKIESQLLQLRLLVGYLGEQNQSGWWQTSILSSVGDRFMGQNFPRSTLCASLNAVKEAAQKNHDGEVGVGKVFHLFRLPYEIEQGLHGSLLHGSEINDAPESKEAAMDSLLGLAKETINVEPGPTQVGTRKTIRSAHGVKQLAKHYHAAFSSGVRCYPYFSDE
jgi:hypothetical protein